VVVETLADAAVEAGWANDSASLVNGWGYIDLLRTLNKSL
jgi:hypothetical protein